MQNDPFASQSRQTLCVHRSLMIFGELWCDTSNFSINSNGFFFSSPCSKALNKMAHLFINREREREIHQSIISQRLFKSWAQHLFPPISHCHLKHHHSVNLRCTKQLSQMVLFHAFDGNVMCFFFSFFSLLNLFIIYSFGLSIDIIRRPNAV